MPRGPAAGVRAADLRDEARHGDGEGSERSLAARVQVQDRSENPGPHQGERGKKFLDYLSASNAQANPELLRIALKLATGAGKTTVIAMLIAWQTINAVRHPSSKIFTRGFVVITPGITIRDRLRVILPSDPDNYYKQRELIPGDLLTDIGRAKVVITNYHAFKLRERMEVSKVGRALLKGRGPELATSESQLPPQDPSRLNALTARYDQHFPPAGAADEE